jgi:Flp pilus assembly protein TadG
VKLPTEDGTNALAATRSVVFNNARTESRGRSGIEETGPFRHMQGDGLRKLREERGASAVEFAIIASLLLMILFGTITFGILLNRYQGLQSAGREGARIGSLTQTTVEQIKNRTSESVSIINASSVTTNCGGWGAAIETGCILIQTKQDNNSDGDTADGGETTTWTVDSTIPCNGVPEQGRSIYVEVRYRLRIDIPLWASPQMTISGAGEFACE